MKSIAPKINPRYVILLILICVILYFVITSIKEGFESSISFDDYNLPPIEVKGKSKYTAVIVEPRKHKALEFVLNNFVDNLDDQWSFVIIHGSSNDNYVKDIITRLSDRNKKRIQLVNLGVDNLSLSQYSEMFFNPLFYKYIPTETFLIFQTDSIIIKENKSKIYDFINYDYVGAPWPASMGLLGKMVCGNGGLSLRKKSKMVELLKYKERALNENQQLKQPQYGKYIAEDQYFCGYFTRNEVPMNKPSFEIATYFSIESVYCESPFGVHKPWLGVSKNDYKFLTDKYPDILTLQKQNN